MTRGKNFFKAREKLGNFILSWEIDILKKSQGTISTTFFHGEGKFVSQVMIVAGKDDCKGRLEATTISDVLYIFLVT